MQGRKSMKPRKYKGVLHYPKHIVDPRDFLTFIELDEFIDDWKSLRLNDDEDLFALQIMIMANPEGSPVIEGTGGLRKLRFSSSNWKTGKRGAARVCYAYFKEYVTALLVAAYSHKEKDNLSPAEKRGIKAYLERIHKYFSERSYK
jgi:hypothetical protein